MTMENRTCTIVTIVKSLTNENLGLLHYWGKSIKVPHIGDKKPPLGRGGKEATRKKSKQKLSASVLIA
jgi:hypothetical protein